MLYSISISPTIMIQLLVYAILGYLLVFQVCGLWDGQDRRPIKPCVVLHTCTYICAHSAHSVVVVLINPKAVIL